MVRRIMEYRRFKWAVALWPALCVVFISAHASADSDPLPVMPGTLVITEIMYLAPAEIEYPLGQWFEVYNASDEDRSLAGLTLVVFSDEKDDGQIYTLEVGAAPVLTGHGYLVLGASKALAINGGVPVTYAYGPGLLLPKQGGVLRVLAGDEIIDEVSFGPGYDQVVPAGHSLNLEPDGMTDEANDQPEFWCESSVPIGGTKPVVFGSPGEVGHTCDSDGDGFDEAMGDCDDFEPKVSPGAQEKCNGIDDDCDGEVDAPPFLDAPTWGDLGVCQQGGPVCLGFDGWDLELPDEWQENETLCDTLDNDCDGEVDEGLRNSCGHCGDALPDLCDGEDNDCDGFTDEDALSPPEEFTCFGDGQGVCKETQGVCNGADGWQCVFAENFEEEEQSCDDVDNDCDGDVDEGYEVGLPCAIGEGACRNQGITVCTPDYLGVMCVGEAALGLVELCGDNEDNDCDGLIDEGFPVGDTCEEGIGACRVTGKFFCSADRLDVDCSAESLEPIQEICGNFLDDDCDGEVDEVACGDSAVDPLAQGCGTGAPGTSALTIIFLLAIPLLAARRRRRRV